MGKEKRVTTTCYGGGNEFPWSLCYNYFSDFIVNIGLNRRVKNEGLRLKLQ